MREWQPWHGGTPSNATAHFVTAVIEYAAGTRLNPRHNFTFFTVKGAGHTVPGFKPIPVYQALMKFFNQSGRRRSEWSAPQCESEERGQVGRGGKSSTGLLTLVI